MFILPIILGWLNLDVPKVSFPIVNYTFCILSLSLIGLLSFLNLLLYLTLYLLNYKYDIYSKFKNYPLIINFINLYYNTTLLFPYVPCDDLRNGLAGLSVDQIVGGV